MGTGWPAGSMGAGRTGLHTDTKARTGNGGGEAARLDRGFVDEQAGSVLQIPRFIRFHSSSFRLRAAVKER